MKIKFQSFRTKILWSNMILVSITLLFLDIVFYTIAQENFTNHVINNLRVIAEDVYLDDVEGKDPHSIVIQTHKYEFTMPNAMVQVFHNGSIVAHSSNLKETSLSFPLQADDGFEKKALFAKPSDNYLLYTHTFKDNHETYTIQVATSLEAVDNELYDVFPLFFALNAIALLFIFFLSRKMLQDVVKPMVTVIQSVHSISASDLSKRIPHLEGNDEFSHLAETFNTMLEKIETSFLQIKRFSDNVSHELKTPLTAIRLHSEIALKKERSVGEYQETLTTIHHEAKKLQTMIDSLLLMAHLETKDFTSSFETIDVDFILLEAFEDAMSLASQKGVILSLKSIEPLRIQGNPSLLQVVFNNLINNAITYTCAHKKVIIALEKGCFVIHDEGAGIDERELPYIFERFFRSSTNSEKGYGLGLFIVQKILTLHNASIDVKSILHKGTTMTVTFPYM